MNEPAGYAWLLLVASAEQAAAWPGLQWGALWEDKGIPLALMGLLVVFSALALIVLFITGLPRLVAAIDGRSSPGGHGMEGDGAHAAASTPSASDGAEAADQIPAHVLVAIAAAVAATIDEPHRIIRTQQLTPSDMAWSSEGRRQHHISHRTRGRW